MASRPVVECRCDHAGFRDSHVAVETNIEIFRRWTPRRTPNPEFGFGGSSGSIRICRLSSLRRSAAVYPSSIAGTIPAPQSGPRGPVGWLRGSYRERFAHGSASDVFSMPCPTVRRAVPSLTVQPVPPGMRRPAFLATCRVPDDRPSGPESLGVIVVVAEPERIAKLPRRDSCRPSALWLE